MDDRLLETWNKLVDFWLKEYWESITLYGQWPPPPEKPWVIVGYPENFYSRGLVESIKEQRIENGVLNASLDLAELDRKELERKIARRGPAESS